MSSESESFMQHDLWTLIQNKRATHSVSLKTLQRFVLSLDRKELTHLIDVYLKSALSSNNPLSGATVRERAESLRHARTHPVDTIDDEILTKMNQNYGEKQNKKTLKIIQQNQSENHHILSMNPEVLAYSLQYLSFRESCKLQHVCSYFVYLKKAYLNMSNYYVNLDELFWRHVFRSKVNLEPLSHFKHIEISCSFHAHCLDDSTYYKTTIFRKILKRILNKSISCLDVLEIDIPRNKVHGYNGYNGYFTVLGFILAEFKQIPIRKLIWNKDGFQDTAHDGHRKCAFQLIESGLTRCCPNLMHFRFGINDFGFQNRWQRPVSWAPRPLVNPTPHLGKHLIPMLSGYHQLQILDLFCPTWNVFSGENIIGLIASKLNHLQKLSIVSYIEQADELNMETNGIKHLSLKELSTEFVIKEETDSENKISIEHILIILFSTFIGIEQFNFGFAIQSESFQTVDIVSNIEWISLFGLLLRQKRMFSMQHGSITCLKSITFDHISHSDAGNVLDSLIKLKAEKYFDLKQFKLNVIGKDTPSSQAALFRTFVDLTFIPFINLFELTKLGFLYGYGCKRYVSHGYPDSNWQSEFCHTPSFPLVPSYFDPIINILSNLPKSVVLLQLKPPKYRLRHDGRGHVKSIESMRLVQKLCNMLADEQGNLETITLDRVELSNKAMDFLIFMFGFNNRLHMKYRKVFGYRHRYYIQPKRLRLSFVLYS